MVIRVRGMKEVANDALIVVAAGEDECVVYGLRSRGRLLVDQFPMNPHWSQRSGGARVSSHPGALLLKLQLRL